MTKEKLKINSIMNIFRLMNEMTPVQYIKTADLFLEEREGHPHANQIGAEDVALLLQVTTKTVRNYAKRGLLTPIRISKRNVKYDYMEVKRLMEVGMEGKI